jgi:hypothetical protein
MLILITNLQIKEGIGIRRAMFDSQINFRDVNSDHESSDQGGNWQSKSNV